MPVTLTLPLTQAGAQVLLAALGIALATGLVYLMLDAQGGKQRSDPAMDWLKALGVALVPVWLILLGGTLWHLWLLFDGQASVLGDAGFGMGAVIAAFLGGPFVIWGTVIKQETVKYQKEGHITERISKAVEQLGAEKTVKRDGGDVTVPNIEVRIGGLLSLERIAQDSTQNDNGRDHVRVMEILCAYVRENAPASEARDFPLLEWEPLPENASKKARAAHDEWGKERFESWQYESHGVSNGPGPRANAREWARSLPKPRADIALALQIIGRRSHEQLQVEAQWGPTAAPDAAWVFDTPCPSLPERYVDNTPIDKSVREQFKTDLEKWKTDLRVYEGYRLDLRRTNLQGADLRHANLSGALLFHSRLDGADLYGAKLPGAYLGQVSGLGSRLDFAQLDGATLIGAQLEAASLRCAKMKGADLSQTSMPAADLHSAQMCGANFVSVVAEYADLRASQLQAADVIMARCFGAHTAGYTPPSPPGD
ncbi:pentapeptide repeat-containing protein [Salibaculum halophilum]|uniref:pentapeptide repeat-containing protein n=1 Tax=Salibaculum halophilum TaxID=1914408 RepID=UPI0015C44A7E|nr:pentapeptide repeat-containing protein [Salibaculum halophilum]